MLRLFQNRTGVTPSHPIHHVLGTGLFSRSVFPCDSNSPMSNISYARRSIHRWSCKPDCSDGLSSVGHGSFSGYNDIWFQPLLCGRRFQTSTTTGDDGEKNASVENGEKKKEEVITEEGEEDEVAHNVEHMIRKGSLIMEDHHDELHSALHEEKEQETSTFVSPKAKSSGESSKEKVEINWERIDRLPAKFDLLTNSIVYRWQTTARYARKLSGPMREWATEIKYITGVHMEMELTYPDRLWDYYQYGGEATGGGATTTIPSPPEGAKNDYYTASDDVDLTLYFFGSERGLHNCKKLMEEALLEEPAYVRLALFRRVKNEKGASTVEWLSLRRINREIRPPDIPPISLKTPGKYTLFHETYLEAAQRTCWEETGVHIPARQIYPTGRLQPTDPLFYWRVPVVYFIAELPEGSEVLGPQVVRDSYVMDFDPRLLRQSPDPVDRLWAGRADPQTGVAWLSREEMNELQRPLKGEDYMEIRYTPPPYSNLREVLGFRPVEEEEEVKTEKVEKEKEVTEEEAKKE